jgi:hypothetical protein
LKFSRPSPPRFRIARLASAVCALLAAAPVALGQAAGPGATQPATVPVYQLPRPDYDAPGIRLDTFLLLPTASQQLGYDGNIFASGRVQTDDMVSTTIESVALNSQWAEHALTARLFAAQEIYLRHGDNDGYTWGGETTGRYDVSGEANLAFNASLVQQPLQRGTPESGASAKRPVYNTAAAGADYLQRMTDASNRLDLSFRQIAYVSSRDATRSGTRYTVTDRFSYDLSPGISLYVQAGYAQQHWLRRAPLRDFNLLTGLAGVSFEIPGRIRADFGAGVVREDFRNGAFHTLVAPIVSEQMIWNVLPLTSIIANVERTITGTETACDNSTMSCVSASGTALPGSAALGSIRSTLDTTAAEIGVQHEIYHDFLADMRLRHQRDHFDFNGLTDRTWVLSLGLRYLINRNLEADFDYIYRDRSANLASDRVFNSGPFTENVVSLTLKAGL